MRIRLVIEYDPDGASMDEEIRDWDAGRVCYLDLKYALDQGEQDVTIRFSEAEHD